MSFAVKLVGAGLMVASGVWGGMAYAARVKERVSELERAVLFLTGLKQELSFSLSPPPDLIRYIASYGEFRETDYIQETARRTGEGQLFREAWKGSVEQSVLPLDPEDRRVLMMVGDILGTSDLDTQVSGLEHCTEQMRARLISAMPKAEERSRLARTIGMLIGVFSAILII